VRQKRHGFYPGIGIIISVIKKRQVVERSRLEKKDSKKYIGKQ
jgi:hypothetical protein